MVFVCATEYDFNNDGLTTNQSSKFSVMLDVALHWTKLLVGLESNITRNFNIIYFLFYFCRRRSLKMTSSQRHTFQEHWQNIKSKHWVHTKPLNSHDKIISRANKIFKVNTFKICFHFSNGEIASVGCFDNESKAWKTHTRNTRN